MFGLTAGALAQGSINLDNSGIRPGLALHTAGNYYSGIYGIQVYILNAALPNNINIFSGLNSSIAFNNLIVDGYTLQATFTGQTLPADKAGTFILGEIDMPGVSPAGSSPSIALVAWVGSAPSFTAASVGGVITFVNPTADYTQIPKPTPKSLSGWDSLNQDLIMAVPEPSMISLTGIGAAALMIVRRRK